MYIVRWIVLVREVVLIHLLYFYIYTNADQLHNKLNELHLRIQDKLPHVTEVKPNPTPNKTEYSLRNVVFMKYIQHVHEGIDDNKRSGSILYIVKDLPAKDIPADTEFLEYL